MAHNIKNKSQDIIQKTRDDYNRIAKHFSDTRKFVWPELNCFKKHIKNDQKILDWGCGNGHLLTFFKGADVSYYGIDISFELIKIAKQLFSKEIKDKKVEFFCVANRQKKFPNNFFDLVFMVASFHHLPDRENRLSVLKKIYKEMKTGAKLFITVWNLKSEWAEKKLHSNWKRLRENEYLIPWKNADGKILAWRYYHNFSKKELNDIIIEVGFEILDIYYYNRNTFSEDKKTARNLVVVAEKP
ncbi:MAG: methyltransferase domain-containing protein [bacterium]